MTIPNVTNKIQDGALGVLPASNATAIAVLGVSSLGTVNALQSFGGNDPSVVTTALGVGPLAEAVAYLLTGGGGPVYAMPVTASTAGVSSSVTHNGTGLCVVTTTGAPLDAYNVLLTIVAGGTNPAAGTATFTYSLDGGVTTSQVTAVPTGGSFVIPGTGMTAVFSSATLVAGDTYTWTATAPSYSLTDLNAALTALIANPTAWKAVWIVGSAATGVAAATIAGGVDTQMTTAESSKRYTYALMSAQDTDANLITAFAAFQSKRVAVSAGTCTVISPLSGRAFTRAASWPMALRLKSIDPGTDPAEFDLGAITGVTAIQRDEQATPALDAKGFSTLRTFPGVSGFYITNVNMMAAPGSDFGLEVRRAVMDQACTIAYIASLQFLNKKLRVDRKTGYIDERDARAWETYVNGQLAAAVVNPNYAVAANINVNRATNVLSSGVVYTQIQILPFAYPNTIQNTIGFVNPALQNAA